MIAASRRRRTQAGDAFRLHEALAARTALSVRLRRGSVLALVASLLALAFGADVTTHLLAVALGLAAGGAVPVRGVREEALAFIRGRAGLSYETALDVMASGADDEFGLRSAVVERARLAVRDVRPEPPPAWWLPALAVALGLVLFSLAGPIAGPRGGSGAGPTQQPGGQTPTTPEAVPPAERQAEEAPAPPAGAPDRMSDPEAGDGRDGGDDGEGSGSPPVGGGGAAAAPLSRFLESLRERPDSTPPPPGDGAGAPSQPGAETPRAQRPAAPAELLDEPQRVQLDRQDQDRAQGQGEGEQDGAEGQGQQEGEGQDQGGDGQEQGRGQEQEQGQQPQGGEEDGGEGEQGASTGASEQAGADDGETPDVGAEAGGEQDGRTPRGLTPDDGSPSPDPGDAEAAGAGPGAESEAGVAVGRPGALDVLPGVLQPGPENPAGTVRLPGDTEVFLPPGRSVTEYRTAAEEALTEGDLPLAYQEVIRRYFR